MGLLLFDQAEVEQLTLCLLPGSFIRVRHRDLVLNVHNTETIGGSVRCCVDHTNCSV